MKKQNKVMVGALALLVMGTSSLAYFTDRAEGNFNAQAGNLCLTHVDSQSDLLNMVPGDLRDISFEYKNEGSLAMDTRVTYMLSYELEDGKAGTTEGKVVTLLDGEDELVTKEVGEGVAKVTVNEATIQGTTDKVGDATLKKNLKLKLHESVANDFQDATFHIDVVVEGKQNKNDAQWEEINTERITVRADELNVVRQSACNVGEDVAEKVTYSYTAEDDVKRKLDSQRGKNEIFIAYALDHSYDRIAILAEDSKLWANGQSYEVDKSDLNVDEIDSIVATIRKGQWESMDSDEDRDSYAYSSVSIEDKEEIKKILEEGYTFTFDEVNEFAMEE